MVRNLGKHLKLTANHVVDNIDWKRVPVLSIETRKPLVAPTGAALSKEVDLEKMINLGAKKEVGRILSNAGIQVGNDEAAMRDKFSKAGFKVLSAGQISGEDSPDPIQRVVFPDGRICVGKMSTFQAFVLLYKGFLLR